MFDLPLGKALVAVEVKNKKSCEKCKLFGAPLCVFECRSYRRKDGKDVIFKTVDLRKKQLTINGV